jgi:hypothetical protein
LFVFQASFRPNPVSRISFCGGIGHVLSHATKDENGSQAGRLCHIIFTGGTNSMKKKSMVTAVVAVALSVFIFPMRESVRGQVGMNLPSLVALDSTQGGSETITMTTVPNQPTRYVFGAADGYPDAVVRLLLRAACTVRVTRIPVLASDIATRCQDMALRGSAPVLEMLNPAGPGGPGQFSVYRIELLSSCPDTAFPIRVEIIYFGAAEVIRTRVVHDPLPPGGQDCRDVTTNIATPKDPNDPDPSGQGTETSFSDYLLVNLPDPGLPTQSGVDTQFEDLRATTEQLLPSEESRLVNAQNAFGTGASQAQQGNLDAARVAFQIAIRLLNEFLNVVEQQRSAMSLRPPDASQLTTRGERLIFKIRAFARRNGIVL